VEKILKKRSNRVCLRATLIEIGELIRRGQGKVEYFVKWEGYDSSEDSWVLQEDILDPELIALFEAHEKEAKKAKATTPVAPKTPKTEPEATRTPKRTASAAKTGSESKSKRRLTKRTGSDGMCCQWIVRSLADS
jgi:hypothetical protein